MKLFICTVLLAASTLLGYAQTSDSAWQACVKAEKQLKKLQIFFSSKNEQDRIEGNKKFVAEWDKILSNPKSLTYPFDSLKEVSILNSKNKKIKLITWNLHKNDGSHIFFGYLLVDNSKKIKKSFLKYIKVEEYNCFKLIDNSMTINNPENFIGSPNKWYGMLYYQLIENDGFYTLLGYDPNNKITQKKFIDILYFKSDGSPIFGKDVFKFARKNPRRLMFEYSSEVSMSLRYDERQNKIVYSHLGPKTEDAILQNQMQYYGPDGSFDALKMEKNKWTIVEDVDARNPKSKNENIKPPDIKDQKKIYKSN
ncbi:MAG: hypothetical protein JSU07_12390 [Bacteroidetes bacterium]|nr:hypothetical protein [Bacteroidota bacterium]